MQTTKLHHLLTILSHEELKTLGLWLESPWANTNKKLTALYKLLQNQYPASSKQGNDKALLFKKLYPGKPYDDKMMRNLMVAMCKQVEKFLAHQRLEKDEFQSRHFLAKEYLERHEYDWYQKQVEELIDKLAEKNVKDTADYLHLSILQEELHRCQEFAQLKLSPDVLKSADRNLDSYYCIQKWRHFTELNERKMMYPESHQMSDILESLENIAKPLDLFIVKIFNQRMALTNDLSLEGYHDLKQAFFSNFDELAVQEQQLFLYYLINSTIHLWLKGNVEVMQELIELYKKGLETGLLFFHGRLSEKTFSNIVTTGNGLRQFDFVNEFIGKYGDKLAPEIKDDANIWATAHTLYKQGNFEKCITILTSHKFFSDHYALQSKILLMQAYFDAFKDNKSYLSFALDFGEAIKKYLYRSEVLSMERKTAYLNFVRYTLMLLKKIAEKDMNDTWRDAYIKQINEEQFMQGKQWLLAQLEEIKTGLPQ